MTSEISTTSLDDVTNASLVEPVIILALSEQPGLAMRYCREFSAIGKATNAIKIPTQTSYWGSPNDRGAGVATAFNASEGGALGNTAVSTGGVTCTAAEYGVAHALTDNVAEDSAIDALELMNLFTSQMLAVMQLALDDDFAALFSGLSNSAGTTNTALTVANMLTAQQGIRSRGTNADAIVYVLDNVPCAYLETSLVTTNAAAAVYALSADRLIGYAPRSDNGMKSNREIMDFRGYPVVANGLLDTANAGVDSVGACFCPSTAYNDASGATTFGMLWKRLPRFETQRQAKGRATDLVMTLRAGVAELQDGSGTAIISKAT